MLSDKPEPVFSSNHPRYALVNPANSVDPEPKTADNRTTTFHLGSQQTFGPTALQLAQIAAAGA